MGMLANAVTQLMATDAKRNDRCLVSIGLKLIKDLKDLKGF